jgi:hypothetical protein
LHEKTFDDSKCHDEKPHLLAICLKNYLTGNTVAHSSGLARLASGAFYIAIQILTFHESINLTLQWNL